MTALDAYRSVLRELDKVGSPTFTPLDFVYFFSTSVDEYITLNYAKGDVFEKDADDLAAVTVDNFALTQDGTDKTLFAQPDDYRHFLYMNVVIKLTIAKYRRWKLNDTITVVVRRQRTAGRGYQEENAYMQPGEDYPQYRASNGKLKVLVGDNFQPVSATLMYIKTMDAVNLNPDPSADFSLEINNSTLEFPDYVCREIIKWCARVFLENIESKRYQTALNERQLRKE